MFTSSTIAHCWLWQLGPLSMQCYLSRKLELSLVIYSVHVLSWRFLFVNVMLIIIQTPLSRWLNKSYGWKFPLNTVFTCWENSQNCQGIFPRSSNPNTFREVTVGISSRSIHAAFKKSNIQGTHESVLRFKWFRLKKIQNSQGTFSQNSLYFQTLLCFSPSTHQPSFYGRKFVEYLPLYDPTFKYGIRIY